MTFYPGENQQVQYIVRGNLVFLQFANINQFDHRVTHCFTTRLGGVSEGPYSSCNLGFASGDNFENVLANFEIVADALGVDPKGIIFSKQVHGQDVRIVTAEDTKKGLGVHYYDHSFDALVTNHRQVVLTAFYADCVPVFFYDPENKAIGLAHSGWKSTVKNISAKVIEVLNLEYGTRPESLQVAIGPSLGPCCFEVGNEVYDVFRAQYPEKIYYKKNQRDKWTINLWNIIADGLQKSGVIRENINCSQICTQCNQDIFFSHRGQKGTTGRLAGFISLR